MPFSKIGVRVTLSREDQINGGVSKLRGVSSGGIKLRGEIMACQIESRQKFGVRG